MFIVACCDYEFNVQCFLKMYTFFKSIILFNTTIKVVMYNRPLAGDTLSLVGGFVGPGGVRLGGFHCGQFWPLHCPWVLVTMF